MPSSATITAFYEFSAGTLIRSARVNTNFSTFRGHLLPVAVDTATAAATLTYDLGADDHSWMNGYVGVWVAHVNSTPAANPSTTTKYKVYMKSDGYMYKLNSAGVESSVVNAGTGGGGGGGSLKFLERSNSPYLTVENNLEVYVFDAGLAQELYAAIRVPQSYVAGSQINMRGLIYNADTSGNILVRTQATLIRAEVDEVTSTTNQRTSTNSAITMSAANDQEPQKVVWDLSSNSGQINAVAISAGDLIVVRLYRDTDTATSEVKFIQLATEVSFS